MLRVAFFDTKPYELEAFRASPSFARLEWQFHEERLKGSTAPLASGAGAVCSFVNDVLDAPALDALAAQGVGLVALRSAGYNHLDVAHCQGLGIRAVRVPAYSPHAVAEHSIALLLALSRKLHKAYNRVRESNFSLSGLVGFELYKKTAGLVGAGRIGRVTAEILRGFGCHVLVHDPAPDLEWSSRTGVQYVELEQLFAESDFVSLYAPLTPETHHLVDHKTLASMKPGAILVNTSRGGLVDTAALIGALKSGHLGGAALDVYEEESGLFFHDLSDKILQDDVLARLLSFPNVLVTSHQAFLTHEALSEIAETTIDNLVRYAEGRPLLHQLWEAPPAAGPR
jgi:D-lactate dehydrogenase